MRHLVCISTMVATATTALGQAASSQAKAAAAAKKARRNHSLDPAQDPLGRSGFAGNLDQR